MSKTMTDHDTMTRAQAVCACRNILQLCGENPKIPEDMVKEISERAVGMEKHITEKSQYSHVTEKMDSALRNMWTGLRRWDRDEKYTDDLFADLDGVAEELADLDASASNVAAPKGKETGETSDALAKKYGGEGAKSGRFQGDKPNVANTPKPAEPVAISGPGSLLLLSGPGSLLLSEILRRKEAAIGFVYNEIHNAAITVINKTSLRMLALGDVLGMTKSDRTQQLIRAAYYVGVLRGVGLLHSKLQNGDA